MEMVCLKTTTVIKVRQTVLTQYLPLSYSPLFSLLLFMDNSHFFIVTVSGSIHLMESQKGIWYKIYFISVHHFREQS